MENLGPILFFIVRLFVTTANPTLSSINDPSVYIRSCSSYLSAMSDVNSACIRSLLAPLRVAHMVRSMVSFLLANHGGRFVELCSVLLVGI
jgi:hypothetical protein